MTILILISWYKFRILIQLLKVKDAIILRLSQTKQNTLISFKFNTDDDNGNWINDQFKRKKEKNSLILSFSCWFGLVWFYIRASPSRYHITIYFLCWINGLFINTRSERQLIWGCSPPLLLINFSFELTKDTTSANLLRMEYIH